MSSVSAAQLGTIFRYGGSPMADQVPADWQDKVMHGTLTFGDQVLMGGDVAPLRYEEPKGFSLSIQIENTTEAERIFHELAKDGRVVMPLEKTFWADALWHGRRSIRDTVADQLRRIRSAAGVMRALFVHWRELDA